jgi:hypothetical protein
MWRHPAEQEPFPAPPAAQAQGYPAQAQNYGYQQQGQGYYFPPEQAPAAQPSFGHFPPAQQVPYPPPPQDWGPQQQQQPPPPDPRGYDLGSYMPADTQAYAPAPTTQYPQHAQHPPQAQHGYGEPDPDFDDMVEDDDEPRRGRRALMVVAALIGAIGLGGGLAYTYKNFVLTKGNSRPPVIKTADLPNKVKPTAPGGKEFAHTDKKLLNRLGEDNSQPASAEAQDRASEERDAPRKVRVIDIKPGDQGSAVAAAPSAPVMVPGLLLDNTGPQPPPGAVRAAPPPPPPQVSAQPPVRSAAPPPVKVVTAPAPAPTPEREEAQPAPKQTTQAAPPKVAVPKSPAAASAPPQTTGTSGYVAVLSSQKSRMDALKAFADLQQKYGDVLLSRTPDVQEADLSARGLGTMYRLVVGPPGSRDAASGVCSQLKTAGYQGCWVMAY